jgi:hypothetical protein
MGGLYYRVLRNYLHYPIIFSEKGHRLLVCRSNLRFNNTTSLGTKLENNLDPAGLLRGQSLATTTKTIGSQGHSALQHATPYTRTGGYAQ